MAKPLENQTAVFDTLEGATKTIVETWSRQGKSWDIVAEPAIASLLVDVRDYKEAYFKMKEKGVKLRVILTVTKDNAKKCLELMRIADVRHLDATIGNFGVGESEYLATAESLREGRAVIQVVQSRDKQAVAKQRELFEKLWSRAIPAKLKIREMQEDRAG